MEYELEQICQYTYELKLKNISFKEFIEKISNYITFKSKFVIKIKINDVNIKIFKGNKIVINSDDKNNINIELKKL